METKQNNVLGVVILVVILLAAFFGFRYLTMSGGVKPSDYFQKPADTATTPTETEKTTEEPKPPYVFLQVEGQECVSCVELKKNLEQVKPLLNDQITFETVNIVDEPKFGEEFQINVLPTILIFDANNQMVFRYEGSLSAEQLTQLFTEMGVKKS